MMGHKVYRTLMFWLVWASFAIAVLLGLYIDTGVWDFVKNDPTKLTWVILGLFFLGVLVSFILTMNITKESIEAALAESAAREKGLMGIDTAPGKHATQRFFASLKEIVSSNSPVDLDALLQTEISFYQRLSHGIAVMGNLLITQGLIGTVIGLSITLAGLSTSLEALGQNEALLLEGLRKAMGGMGTAFYATLMGAVFGGLLLRVFALITENGVEDLQDRVMKICLVHCAADRKLTEDKDVRLLNAEVASLAENARLLRTAFEDSKQAMLEFREEAKRLANFGDGLEKGDDLAALREAIRMQKHYRVLLRQEIKLVDQVNRAWWPPLRRLFRSARARPPKAPAETRQQPPSGTESSHD